MSQEKDRDRDTTAAKVLLHRTMPSLRLVSNKSAARTFKTRVFTTHAVYRRMLSEAIETDKRFPKIQNYKWLLDHARVADDLIELAW